MITLEHADAIVTGTLEHARQLGAAPLTVAVLDPGGHMVVLKRQDGSGILRQQIAVGKAWGSLGMGFNSREQARRAESTPGFFTAISVASEGRVVPVPGGVLIRNADGVLLGAVGVSGDLSDVDEACAIYGVRLAGSQPEPESPVEL
jgi:uncharacterized protein GlcG (DUF336 family)